MILLISGLLFLSLFFECYGFMFRYIGVLKNVPSLGYSLHVQIATIGRFGTLLAYPLIAYKLETGVSNSNLSLIPVFTFLALSVGLYYFTISIKNNIVLVNWLLSIISKISRIKIKLNNLSYNDIELKVIISNDQKRKIIYFGTFAFLFTSSSFFITSVMANHYLHYRTTIILLTPFLSSIGTLLSVLFFDPTISQLIDENPKSIGIILLAWKARIYGSIMTSILFFIFYITLSQ